MKKSFLDCPHNNVQDFTECCMDCGYNVWTTKKEYLADLKRQAERDGVDDATRAIRKLEKRLGIE